MSKKLEIGKTIVHARWIDSTGWSRWHGHDDVEEFANANQDLIDSIGVVVGDTKENLTIAQSVGKYEKDAIMKIPRVAVRSIKVIGKI